MEQTQHGQMGQQGMQSGGTLPQQYRASLASVAQAIAVCGWCADQCIQSADPHMIECIRLCEDVVELGETVLATVPRSSRSTPQIVQAFQQAAQACAQECGQHEDAHCQDCASVLPEAISAASQLTSAGQQTAGMAQQTGTPTQQMGGQAQQMGGQAQQMGGTGQQMGAANPRQTW